MHPWPFKPNRKQIVTARLKEEEEEGAAAYYFESAIAAGASSGSDPAIDR
jgi:hypothetical protein